MKSLDIAHAFINRCDASLELTNLKLNKLVYYAQVESIRRSGALLFDDAIEAWRHGPVEPMVYHAFKQCGRSCVPTLCYTRDVEGSVDEIVRCVADTYGRLSAFDLVSLSHREGGAWSLVYRSDADVPITREVIEQSEDIKGFPGFSSTLERGIREAYESIPNALKLLENS